MRLPIFVSPLAHGKLRGGGERVSLRIQLMYKLSWFPGGFMNREQKNPSKMILISFQAALLRVLAHQEKGWLTI